MILLSTLNPEVERAGGEASLVNTLCVDTAVADASASSGVETQSTRGSIPTQSGGAIGLMVRRYVPEGLSLVSELIADRHMAL